MNEGGFWRLLLVRKRVDLKFVGIGICLSVCLRQSSCLISRDGSDRADTTFVVVDAWRSGISFKLKKKIGTIFGSTHPTDIQNFQTNS